MCGCGDLCAKRLTAIQVHQLVLNFQRQLAQCFWADRVCFGDHQQVSTLQLCACFGMVLENLLCCGGTQTGDHASQPVTLLQQILVQQNLTDGPGFCQPCGLDDHGRKAGNASLQTRPKQVLEGLRQARQTCATHTGIGDQGGRAFTGTAQQLMVQTHLTQLVDHQRGFLQQRRGHPGLQQTCFATAQIAGQQVNRDSPVSLRIIHKKQILKMGDGRRTRGLSKGKQLHGTHHHLH